MPSAARQRSETPYKWRFAGVPMKALRRMLHGSWTSIAKKPYIFVIFNGMGSGPPDPYFGSAHGDYLISGSRIKIHQDGGSDNFFWLLF